MPFTRISAVLLTALSLAGSTFHVSAAGTESLWLGDEDRLLVLAAHPDDETLAAGGLIQEALDLDLPVRVCFFTMGDNNEIAALFTRRHPMEKPGATRAMGTLRQHEAVASSTQLGLSTNDLLFLGYPDSGTLDIWNQHWRDAPPLQSLFTQATAVPFENARSTGAPYCGESILEDLSEVIWEFQPTHIVMPHSADHNVDHRALALFTRIALWDLESLDISAKRLAAPVHFTQWPEPRRAQPQRPDAPPYFLNEQIDWIEYGLASYQISNKVAALQRHHSQTRMAPDYMNSFVRKTEIFGDTRDLSFPGGFGTAEWAEDDDSQFRADDDGVQALQQTAPQVQAIAEQQAAETRALQGAENDFLAQALDGDGVELTLSCTFLNPLSSAVTLRISLFAYQADRPFAHLPKVVIEIRDGRITSLQDLDRFLPEASVALVSSAPDTVTVRIPFALLGNPEKILTSAELSKGSLPVDWTPWRILDCTGEPFPEGEAETVREISESPRPVPSTKTPAEKQPTPAAALEKKPARLTPRVRLTGKGVPAHSEADEPVLW